MRLDLYELTGLAINGATGFEINIEDKTCFPKSVKNLLGAEIYFQRWN